MVNTLVAIIIVLAIFQERYERRIPALVFALLTFVHCALLSDLEGFWYFSTAAMCDVVIVWTISKWCEVNRVSDALIFISSMSVALNFYGWFLWENYFPVMPYNILMTVLYFIAILFLLGKDCANEYSGNNKRGVLVRLFKCKRLVSPFSLSKKARL